MKETPSYRLSHSRQPKDYCVQLAPALRDHEVTFSLARVPALRNHDVTFSLAKRSLSTWHLRRSRVEVD